MRLNVITDDEGNVVAATQGHVIGEPEGVAAWAEAAQDTGGVVLLPGQTVMQVEVSDSLFSADSSAELHRHITEALSS
jgi:hypothetical protein